MREKCTPGGGPSQNETSILNKINSNQHLLEISIESLAYFLFSLNPNCSSLTLKTNVPYFEMRNLELEGLTHISMIMNAIGRHLSPVLMKNMKANTSYCVASSRYSFHMYSDGRSTYFESLHE